MFRVMALPTCQELEEFAYDFLEGRLPTETTHKIERHMKLCRNCLRFIESYRRIKMAGPAVKLPPLDPEFKEKLFEVLLLQKQGPSA